MKLLSIIIPTYNEENTIEQLVKYVSSVSYPIDFEIIIIDDASIDRTYEKELLLKKMDKGLRIFKNRLNAGKGFSVRKGIRRARGDIIVIQDADTEYNPQEIPALIEPILREEYQVVYGSRFLTTPHPKGMAFLNFIANKTLTKFTNFLFGLRLTDMETCYKAFRADTVKHLSLKANRFTFEPEVTALLAKKGIPIKELPISYNGRSAKEGKKIKAKDFFYAILILLWQRIQK